MLYERTCSADKRIQIPAELGWFPDMDYSNAQSLIEKLDPFQRFWENIIYASLEISSNLFVEP